MLQGISFEEFESEIGRIATDMANYVAYENPIKRAVGLQCAEHWMECLRDLIQDVKDAQSSNAAVAVEDGPE